MMNNKFFLLISELAGRAAQFLNKGHILS